MLAMLDRRSSQILAVDFKKIEGAQDRAAMVAGALDQFEHGEAVRCRERLCAMPIATYRGADRQRCIMSFLDFLTTGI
jgi:hypothetical protein